nr:molybdate ABC transporter substrate-binding protein [Actinomycetota bacterium]
MHVRTGVLLLAVLLAACGGGQSASPPDAASQPASVRASEALSGELTVFAAASLTDAFEDIGERFTAANPDVEV